MEGLSLQFSHDHEEAHPGYYKITFDNGIQAEFTVTERAGIARMYFPRAKLGTEWIGERQILIKADASATARAKNRENDIGSVEVRGKDTIVGTVHSGGFCGSPTKYVLYFVVKFQTPFPGSFKWARPFPVDHKPPTTPWVGAAVDLSREATRVVMKAGISFVSIANAEANLAKEIPGWDFDAVHAAAKAKWTKALDKVQANGGAPEQRTIFYTGIYHSLLSPNVFSDENGDYT